MVVSTQVKALEELIIPKSIPLVLPKIRIGIEVTLIDSLTHVSEVFSTLNLILKDTPITKRP